MTEKSSMLPSRIWQEMQSLTNSWQLFFKVLISFVFESPFRRFGVLNIEKLFCLMGSYKLSSFSINLLLRNAWNCSFPILSIMEIVSITWWPTISRESETVTSCDSSVNGLPHFSNTSTKLWYVLLKLLLFAGCLFMVTCDFASFLQIKR